MTLRGATALLLLLLPTLLQAQDEEPDRGIPGEALRRKRQDVAAVQAKSSDPAVQQRALDLVEELLTAREDEFQRRNEEILSHLLLPPRVTGDVAAAATYPQVRLRAAELAGRIDTKGAADTLLQALDSDPDPAVLSAVARALPSMRYVDPSELAARFGELLMRENVTGRYDDRLASALITGAIELYREWGVEDALLVRAILQAREAPYSRETRQMAGRFVEAVLEG
ncbi:MAG: HEAT repeat domain-containing protein [Alkalispirochaetaceae bacterium]